MATVPDCKTIGTVEQFEKAGAGKLGKKLASRAGQRNVVETCDLRHNSGASFFSSETIRRQFVDKSTGVLKAVEALRKSARFFDKFPDLAKRHSAVIERLVKRVFAAQQKKGQPGPTEDEVTKALVDDKYNSYYQAVKDLHNKHGIPYTEDEAKQLSKQVFASSQMDAMLGKALTMEAFLLWICTSSVLPEKLFAQSLPDLMKHFKGAVFKGESVEKIFLTGCKESAPPARKATIEKFLRAQPPKKGP